MSFSSEIKEELAARIGAARHCRLAELQAILRMQGGVWAEGELRLKKAPALACRKFFTILQKTFNIDAEYSDGIVAGDPERLRDIRPAITEECGGRSCCRRAFLRGAFLCAGTVNDPAKSYHLEIVCRDQAIAAQVAAMMRGEGLHPGETERSGRVVVYLKDGEDIVELLGYMEAQRGLLKMENERVIRDVRGNINRRVNLETANIGKTVGAAARQIGVIEWLLSDRGRLAELPTSLREMAQVRLDHPEATLEELGAMLHPPVGKSGVNHRLRRILDFAKEKGFDEERIPGKKEEEENDHEVNRNQAPARAGSPADRGAGAARFPL